MADETERSSFNSVPPGQPLHLDCPCGTRLKGATEDELVDVAMAHLKERHPDMADFYTRDHILVMAY